MIHYKSHSGNKRSGVSVFKAVTQRKKRRRVHLFHRQWLTPGGGPSYRRRPDPAVHLPGTGPPLHSLAV